MKLDPKKRLFFVILYFLIIQFVYAEDTSPILSWDDPRLGKEGSFPKPTREEVSSAYAESQSKYASTEAMASMEEQSSVMGPDYYETSEYLIGDVSVGLIFVQCTNELNPDCNEVWSTAEKNEVTQDIITGLNWLGDQEPRAEVERWRSQSETVSIPVKPTDFSSGESMKQWIGPTMGVLGYPQDIWGVFEYVNYLREWGSTDWAFVIFIVKGFSTTDGYYSWAFLHGPYVVMTEELYGQQENRAILTVHETGHIFGALDEYCKPDYGCCNCNQAGPDNQTVPNIMCEAACFTGEGSRCFECIWGGGCVDDSNCGEDEFCDIGMSPHRCKHKCVMKALYYWNPQAEKIEIWNIGTFSRAQLGWRNCDNDEILDPLENINDVCGYSQDTDGTDTTSSRNYTVKGTCSGGCDVNTWSCNGGKTDYCTDDSYLAEYYIINDTNKKSDSCAQIKINCTVKYGPTYGCHDGKCACTGDLDVDGDVDWFDFGRFANAFGTSTGDPRYNPDADFDNDGVILWFDFGNFSKNYGKTC